MEVKGRKGHHMGRVREGVSGRTMGPQIVNQETAFYLPGVCTSIPYISNGHLGTNAPNEAHLQHGQETLPSVVSYLQDLSPFYQRNGLQSQINPRKYEV